MKRKDGKKVTIMLLLLPEARGHQICRQSLVVKGGAYESTSFAFVSNTVIPVKCVYTLL